MLGTPKEVQLLNPAHPFYKGLAVDCSRSQISIDVFNFSQSYADIATLSKSFFPVSPLFFSIYMVYYLFTIFING